MDHDTSEGDFIGPISDFLRAVIGLFKGRTFAGIFRTFHKTKNPQQIAAGLI
jgi:hypothetical protein